MVLELFDYDRLVSDDYMGRAVIHVRVYFLTLVERYNSEWGFSDGQ